MQQSNGEWRRGPSDDGDELMSRTDLHDRHDEVEQRKVVSLASMPGLEARHPPPHEKRLGETAGR